MTREEAKSVVEDMLVDAEKYGDIDYYNLNDFISACKVAIKALSDDSAKKDMLIGMLRHSSQYNTPCPEWVYDVIRNS